MGARTSHKTMHWLLGILLMARRLDLPWEEAKPFVVAGARPPEPGRAAFCQSCTGGEGGCDGPGLAGVHAHYRWWPCCCAGMVRSWGQRSRGTASNAQRRALTAVSWPVSSLWRLTWSLLVHWFLLFTNDPSISKPPFLLFERLISLPFKLQAC